jgi:hypothetical protein
METLVKICLVIVLGWVNCAAGKDCVGLVELQNQNPPSTSLMKNILSLFRSDMVQTLPACSAANGVLNKVNNHTVRGGTRLETEKPLDPAKAQANLQAALSNPSVKGRLAELQRIVKDDNTRLFFEAAIFDEEGYYGARELRIQELQQRLH